VTGRLVGALTALAILAGPSPASALDVYVTDSTPFGAIYQLTGAPNGELVPKQPAKVQSGGQYPSSLALSADGRSLYVVNSFSGNVGQFWIKADGSLMPNDPPTAPAGARPQSIALSPDGRNAYVTNAGPATISVYRVDGDGNLVPKADVPGGPGSDPSGIAISPDGQYAYVTNYHSRTISQFVITRSGKLVLNDPPVVGAGEFPRAIIASPAGSVYVVNEYSDAIGQYTIGPGGGLVPKTPALVGTGNRPSTITITPNGRNAYVANLGRPGGVSQYSVGAEGGLIAKSPALVSSGGFAGIAASPGGESIFTADESYFVSRFWLGDGGALTLGRRTQIGSAPRAIVARDSTTGRRSDLRLGRTRRNQVRGTARLSARAGRNGRLQLTGKGIRRVRKHARKGRSVALMIRPRGSKLRELRRQGWVDVRVRVELDPARGESTHRSREIRLLLAGT
jgi:6-phosphogluconolactonase (cycloisomerase 2 family)